MSRSLSFCVRSSGTGISSDPRFNPSTFQLLARPSHERSSPPPLDLQRLALPRITASVPLQTGEKETMVSQPPTSMPSPVLNSPFPSPLSSQPTRSRSHRSATQFPFPERDVTERTPTSPAVTQPDYVPFSAPGILSSVARRMSSRRTHSGASRAGSDVSGSPIVLERPGSRLDLEEDDSDGSDNSDSSTGGIGALVRSLHSQGKVAFDDDPDLPTHVLERRRSQAGGGGRDRSGSAASLGNASSNQGGLGRRWSSKSSASKEGRSEPPRRKRTRSRSPPASPAHSPMVGTSPHPGPASAPPDLDTIPAQSPVAFTPQRPRAEHPPSHSDIPRLAQDLNVPFIPVHDHSHTNTLSSRIATSLSSLVNRQRHDPPLHTIAALIATTGNLSGVVSPELATIAPVWSYDEEGVRRGGDGERRLSRYTRACVSHSALFCFDAFPACSG